MRRSVFLPIVVLAALAGCGDGSDSTGPEHWAEVWCDIDGSSTHDDLIDLMGEPTRDYAADGGAPPQSLWETGTVNYKVYYDFDGRVYWAVFGDPKAIRKSGEPAPFHCPLFRSFRD